MSDFPDRFNQDAIITILITTKKKEKKRGVEEMI